MTGAVVLLACALAVAAIVALDDWLRERKEYEQRIREVTDLLAQLHEPEPTDMAREWRAFLRQLPEVRR